LNVVVSRLCVPKPDSTAMSASEWCEWWCLRDVPEHEIAFATYVQLRRARVEEIVKYSARVGRTKTAGRVGRRLRDLVMPFALKAFANSKAHAWMYTYHIDWSERIEAPRKAA
jgi:hypothetical protein